MNEIPNYEKINKVLMEILERKYEIIIEKKVRRVTNEIQME